ncbi:hypothetical protein DX908_14435 [Parvularcula marina]|uniref:AAA+ ATPase domain-containing protein n=2 Tax=Parvularcula marina TaxID=2292771 RepID=A0A371R7P9_9PROT|nr:hypothetical protein DX908_14435 [Parvularcula marina]
MSTMSATSPSGLTVSPFTDNPDAPVFVETEAHRRAVAQARFGIEQGSGLVVITGEPGSGKTAVLDRTAFLCASDEAALVRLSANEVEGENLEAVILRVLRTEEPGIDPDASLEESLLYCREGGTTPALLIDDADDLGDEGLGVLKRIAEMEQDGDPLFRIVIAGRPALRSVFYRDDMAALRQVMAASHQLGALSRDEVGEYVDTRIRSAGFSSEVIPTVEFLDALAEQSGGNPGRINKLASRAIAQAGLAGRSELMAIDLEAEDGAAASQGDDGIEDAEVVSALSREEVAAAASQEMETSLTGNTTSGPKAPVTVTDLNAAIELLGQGRVPSRMSPAEQPDQEGDVSTQAAIEEAPETVETEEPATAVAADPSVDEETGEEIDVWEPASALTEEEEERIDTADLSEPLPAGPPVMEEMQAFVDDMRTQIDSLRNTIESLRAEAQKLDQRHKAAREKIGGRIDAIQAKIDEFRRGG